MDSSSPLDPINFPSHNFLILQDIFIPFNSCHDPLPNQDQDIPSTTSIIDSLPSQELTSTNPSLVHIDVPSTKSTNNPPCQDKNTPYHGSIPSTPLYNPIILSIPPHNPLRSQDKITPSFVFHEHNPSQYPNIPHNSPHDPNPLQDLSTPIQSIH